MSKTTPIGTVEAFLRATDPDQLTNAELREELLFEAAAAGEEEPAMWHAVRRYYAAWATVRAEELQYAGSGVVRLNRPRHIWQEVCETDPFASAEFGNDARDSAWALNQWFDERVEEAVGTLTLHLGKNAPACMDALGEWLTSGFDNEDPFRAMKRRNLVRAVLVLREQMGAGDYCPAPRPPSKGAERDSTVRQARRTQTMGKLAGIAARAKGSPAT